MILALIFLPVALIVITIGLPVLILLISIGAMCITAYQKICTVTNISMDLNNQSSNTLFYGVIPQRTRSESPPPALTASGIPELRLSPSSLKARPKYTARSSKEVTLLPKSCRFDFQTTSRRSVRFA